METHSANGDVTRLCEAKINTTFNLLSREGELVILQDAQGIRYRLAASATDYKPPALSATRVPLAVTNRIIQVTPSASVKLTPTIPAPIGGHEPVLSGRKTIQFTGECPTESQPRRHIRYGFDLNQEHFWLFIPWAYDGHAQWGVVVFISPAAKTEELKEGWGTGPN